MTWKKTELIFMSAFSLMFQHFFQGFLPTKPGLYPESSVYYPTKSVELKYITVIKKRPPGRFRLDFLEIG